MSATTAQVELATSVSEIPRSTSDITPKGRWISISICALILISAVVGILFGLKVIGSGSPSADGSASVKGNGDLSTTGADSISFAESSTSALGRAASVPNPKFGTYTNPFRADSPWNSRPLDPVFDTYVIPPNVYYPAVQDGEFSTQMFYAVASDPAVTVTAAPDSDGLSQPDLGWYSSVTIPHWPSATSAASGSDGHCDIYDSTTGIIHSFWVLVQNSSTKKWTAALYSWTHVNGTGWGDPAHSYQGARATGVPSAAGLIRSHEVNDGLPYFRHALTMSLPVNALSRDPTYVFPATSADNDAENVNYGLIPEGSLMMLPPSFNVSQLTGWPLRKIATTLQRYGAYVTDRNGGTPYALYVENGGQGFPLSNATGWDNQVAYELQLIRLGLRRVINVTKWVDGNDQARTPLVPGTPNILSMRGPWDYNWGPASTSSYYFDTWKQALVFTQSTSTRTQVSNTNGLGLRDLLWIGTTPDTMYTFSVKSIGDAQLNLQVMVAGNVFAQSGFLTNGQSWSVKWPAGGYGALQALSGVNTASQVIGELHPQVAVPYSMSVGKFVPPPHPTPAATTPYPDPAGLPKLSFGTYQTPFTASSPWNSRPLNPVLEAPLIPLDQYYPTVDSGSFSTQIFRATASDPPQTIQPNGGPNGLSNPDTGSTGPVTLPHWPAATQAASGTDGHADIYDVTTGLIHSFWQLEQDPSTKVWSAALYSWTHINGTGWGDPVHYYQGPRATGISSGAGLIRNHEINDGLPFFRHALTMSLTFSGLSGSDESGGPGYVFPATSADSDLSMCYGHIPEGSLLMLPPSFNVSQLQSGWALRKVAETLKRYGAYVTDRNGGTPFNIYVENGGAGFPLSNVSGWDNQVADDLQTIRASLSRVLSASQWIDGNSQPRSPLSPGTPNLLSMRGPWDYNWGPGSGDFDTWKQAVVFPQVKSSVTQISATNGRGYADLTWAQLIPNANMTYIVHATGGATLELQIMKAGNLAITSGALGNGQTFNFTWPSSGAYIFLIAQSGINQVSSVWGELKHKTVQPFNFATGAYYPYTPATPSSSSSSTGASGGSSSSSTGVSGPQLKFGTYTNPFRADSPWNSRPLDPVFDTYVIPPNVYYPAVQDGEFSTQMFYAVASDPAVTVTAAPDSDGLSQPDLGWYSSVTIPHWPSATSAASGSDGHCDIYDSTTGIIHSFWVLVQNSSTKKWTAALYSWTHVNGTGWGDPAHSYQGARATGVPSAAGLIRSHEVNDGLPYFRHALTMSLPVNALSRDPTYVFPATSADNDAENVNYGLIPEGSLMMLPPSFNVSQLTGWPLRKIATTLQRYGAYVTDRNGGTPYALYVENGGQGFPLSNATGWDNQVAYELQLIRLGLRRVINVTKWVDGNDQARTPLVPGTPNILSMRGPWDYNWGPASTSSYYFDTWKQALVFTQSTSTRTQVSNTNGLGLRDLLWIGTTPDTMYTFSVKSIGDAQLNLQVMVAGNVFAQSGFLTNGQSWSVKWPAGGYGALQALSGVNTASQVIGELHPQVAVPYSMSVGKFVPPPHPTPAATTPYPDPAGLPKLSFGTYQTPFTASSPWNSRPLNPVLEAPLIPLDQYYPTVDSGSFSTQIFRATASDPPQTIQPNGGPNGLSNPDTGSTGPVTLPHWPAATQAASGTDGHADIYDVTTGLIHSFWQLEQDPSTKVWSAALYSWTHINGTGWGDPVHYYQGPRATGISSGAGLIRNHEINDGLPFFRHALTMSLTFSGLSGSDESGGPGYVFPATSADSDLSMCYGHIPEGSLLMLPPSFNVSQLQSGWALRKVAETLKRYGAYVTDRNGGTPFNIYVENGGAGFPLSNVSGWDNQVADDLQTIRASLSRVLSASQWIDGNSQPRSPLSPGTPNLLSMRGPWDYNWGPGSGDFDTWKQAVVFPQVKSSVTQISATNGRGYADLTWAQLIPNANMTYIVHATGGATLELQIMKAGNLAITSGALGNGQTFNFTWPSSGAYIFLIAQSGINQVSSVWGELKHKTVQPFNFATGAYYPYP